LNFLNRILNTQNRHFRVNVIGFLIVGFLLLVSFTLTSNHGVLFITLEVGGVVALLFSTYGAIVCYYGFFYNYLALIRAFIYGSLLFFVLFIIGIANVGIHYPLIGEILSCFLFLMYFATLGTINAFFGKYISLFSVVVFLIALYKGEFNEPFIWVNILDLMEIKNPAIQWFIIIVSALLGAKETIKEKYESLISTS